MNFKAFALLSVACSLCIGSAGCQRAPKKPSPSPAPPSAPAQAAAPLPVEPSLSAPKTPDPKQTRRLPVICIDPGHSSENGVGTRGKITTELNIAWEVAVLLKAKLLKANYRVVMTKNAEKDSVSNEKRAEIANQAKADLMLRLHCDAGYDSGFATFAPDRQGKINGVKGPPMRVVQQSRLLGKKFHAAAISVLKPALKDRGLRTDMQTAIGSKQGALTGSIYAQTPVLLVEMCVLQNRSDETFIASRQGKERMADALFAGVEAAMRKRN